MYGPCLVVVVVEVAPMQYKVFPFPVGLSRHTSVPTRTFSNLAKTMQKHVRPKIAIVNITHPTLDLDPFL